MRGLQGTQRAQVIGEGVEPKARLLPNIKSLFGPCKPPQLLFADENKNFLLILVIVIIGPDMKMYIHTYINTKWVYLL